MRRFLPVLTLCAAGLFAQEPAARQAQPQQEPQLKRERPQPPKSDEYEAPREEDEGMGVREYSFNPLQSQKEVRVGNYYAKQGNFRAALGRYREAVKWNERNSDAWLKLAQAAEKTKDREAATEGYTRYLALEPDARDASEVRKRMAKLK
jgi:tetratricopeptide (TPR) repeat protein